MCPLQRSGMCFRHPQCPLIGHHSESMKPGITHDFLSEQVPLLWFSVFFLITTSIFFLMHPNTAELNSSLKPC